MSYLVDLHIHYKRRKRMSKLDSHAKSACQAAVARGLHAIAFTEHWEHWGSLDGLRAHFPGLIIYSGVEVSKRGTDFLVFLKDEPPEGEVKFDAVMNSVCENGACVLAHPWRKGRPPIVDGIPLCGIEMRSTHTPVEYEASIREMAKSQDLLLLCNSDAHKPSQVGTYYNLWEYLPKDNAALVAHLRRSVEWP